MTVNTGSLHSPVGARRWVQLAFGILAMMVIANPQYVWTLFVRPLQIRYDASLAAVQTTFSILIVVQTWLAPLQGYLIERFGPRSLITFGAGLSGLGWVLAAISSSLVMIYLSYGLLCGIGTGIVYVGIVGLTVKWFPDKRGFATGLVVTGYGLGTFLTTFPISYTLESHGLPFTLMAFGILFAVLGVIVGLGIQEPPESLRARPALSHDGPLRVRDVAPLQMIRSPIFWVLMAISIMMSAGGLMIVSQFAAFSRDFGVASALIWGLPAVPFALTLDRLTNGATRPFFGWVSDRIGRENTMTIAFTLEALAVALLVSFRHDPVLFVLLSGLVFFGWGEIFTLLPTTLTDTFGEKNATLNYGILYLGQGVGSVLGGPVAAYLHDSTGSWTPIFATIITADLLSAMLAAVVLKPMRRRSIPRLGQA